jgi:hypothetical protein
MSSAVPKRPAKLLTIRLPKAGKAGILKFDRHAGVIVVEKNRADHQIRLSGQLGAQFAEFPEAEQTGGADK